MLQYIVEAIAMQRTWIVPNNNIGTGGHGVTTVYGAPDQPYTSHVETTHHKDEWRICWNTLAATRQIAHTICRQDPLDKIYQQGYAPSANRGRAAVDNKHIVGRILVKRYPFVWDRYLREGYRINCKSDCNHIKEVTCKRASNERNSIGCDETVSISLTNLLVKWEPGKF